MEKTEKKAYGRSFGKRLTWRIMLTMFVVMGLTSVLIFKVSSNFMMTAAYIFGNAMVKDKSSEIHHILSDIHVASVNTIPVIEAQIDHPDAMAPIMERIVRLNPQIRSCGISFTDNYYPAKGHRFCPYAVQRDSVTIETRNLNDSTHKYLDERWFVQGLKSTGIYWSEPFFDGTDKQTPLVSCLAPIHDSEGRTVAVLGADYQLTNLEEEVTGQMMEELEMAGDDDLSSAIYFFIVDSAGTYIMHPDKQRILRDNYVTEAARSGDAALQELGKEITSGDKGMYAYADLYGDLILEDTHVEVFYYPIMDTSWTLCLVLPTFFVNIVSYILGGLLLLLVGIGLTVVFFVGRRSIRKAVAPLGHLAASTGEVAKGNFEAPLPEVTSRDEIQQLRDSFGKMQQSLSLYVDELKMTTIQKASIENELKIAHNIQMSMLPKTFPERGDIGIYGMLKPAKAVGGDLFDFYFRNDKLMFCIGDVSGKGVPASLFMAVTRSLFRNVSLHVAEPYRIVRALNKSMSENNEQDMFVTFFVGVLDLKTGVLDYCNAGHNAPVMMDGTVAWLDCDANLPVAVMGDWTFTQQQVTLKPGTTIFLYTDGLNEAENAAHDQFGDDRILEELRQQGDVKPQPLVEHMAEAVREFAGEAEQSDDVTLLAIRYR